LTSGHDISRRTDALVAVCQLDLAEMGFMEELCQLAHELGIHLEFCHGRTLREGF